MPATAQCETPLGQHFWWRSYFTVFLLQGFLMCVVALPIWFVNLGENSQGFSILDFLGIALWSVGFYFEVVSDWQLTVFKSNPQNRGKLITTGLWRLSRHPNYFGETLIWWGYFLFACNSAHGWLSAVGPALMSFLLLRVSGVTLLESTMQARPGFAEYQASTPAFWPKWR